MYIQFYFLSLPKMPKLPDGFRFGGRLFMVALIMFCLFFISISTSKAEDVEPPILPANYSITLDITGYSLDKDIINALEQGVILNPKFTSTLPGSKFHLVGYRLSDDKNWIMLNIRALDSKYDYENPKSLVRVLGQKLKGKWILAPESTRDYYKLLEKAPLEFIPQISKNIWNGKGAKNQTQAVTYKFPWERGAVWRWWDRGSYPTWHGGKACSAGWNSEYCAVDFGTSEENRKVLASASGVVNIRCMNDPDMNTVNIGITDANGVELEYWHINHGSVNPSLIYEGAYVYQGQDLGDAWVGSLPKDCEGGYANQTSINSHVHMFLPTSGINIDGWDFKYKQNFAQKEGEKRHAGRSFESTNDSIEFPHWVERVELGDTNYSRYTGKMDILPNGDFVTSGLKNNNRAFVSNFDYDGSLLWEKEFYVNTGSSGIYDIASTNNNSFLIAGFQYSNNKPIGWIALLDNDGNIINQKYSQNIESWRSIKFNQTSNQIMLVGRRSVSPNYRVVISSLDSELEEIQTYEIDVGSTLYQYVEPVLDITYEGEVVIGVLNKIILLSTGGDLLGVKNLTTYINNNTFTLYPTDILVDKQNNILVTGDTDPGTYHRGRTFIIKLNSDLEYLESNTFRFYDSGGMTGVFILPNTNSDGYILGGNIDNTHGGVYYHTLLSLNSNLNIIGEHKLSTNVVNYFHVLQDGQLLDDERLAIYGYYYLPHTSTWAPYLWTVDQTGVMYSCEDTSNSIVTITEDGQITLENVNVTVGPLSLDNTNATSESALSGATSGMLCYR